MDVQFVPFCVTVTFAVVCLVLVLRAVFEARGWRAVLLGTLIGAVLPPAGMLLAFCINPGVRYFFPWNEVMGVYFADALFFGSPVGAVIGATTGACVGRWAADCE